MREKIIAFLLVLSLFSLNKTSFSQEAGKPSRQMSFDAFSKGDYEQAYKGFSQLLVNYPKDPLYKYYSAVSLIKLSRQPSDAQKMLEEALAAPVKALPEDALFYLGRARQMQGDFSGAEQAFKSFSSKAGKKIAKDLDVDNYLRECKMGQGKIEASKTVQADAQRKDESNPAVADVKKTEPVVKQSEKLPQDVDKKMQTTLDQQYKADSLSAITAENKKQAVIRPAADKSDIQNNIASTSADVQNPEVKVNPPVTEKKAVDSSIITSQKADLPKTEMNIQQDTGRNEQSSMLKQAGVFSVFEILPKPITDPKEKIEINPAVPD